MNENKFIEDVENLLEMEPGSINLNTQIKSLDKWDSLAFVSFLAVANSTYGVKVSSDNLREAKTVGDLMKLVSKA